MMSSSDSDEDFVSYGTPLEPLDEDTIPKKRAIGVEDQVAKDKHGRRRFHGAFTGGFSAGFFNTVGSLEGWKPSQFKSSRSLKTTSQQLQRPEDFMDDEDMDEFGIAPKTIGPTENYNQNRGGMGPSRKRSLMNSHDNRIPGIPVLETILEPVKETIGIKLLMKMGWKPGQGVGPRLSKAEKTVQQKYYGCSLPGGEETPEGDAIADDSEDELVPDVTFAPDDYEPYLVKPKNNVFGLGYSGLDRRPVLSSHINLFEPATSSLVMTEKSKKVSIRGQAFGVGAFENEDDDIYAKDDMSQYDFALDTPQMLADKRKKNRNESQFKSTPTDVLEGFLAQPSSVVRKRYAPPILPQGYTGQHQTRQSRFSGAAAPADHRPRLTAAERAILVSVEPTPQVKAKLKPSKVDDNLPQHQNTNNAPEAPEGSVSGFRPFLDDPDKQLRYETFISVSKTEQTEKLKSVQPVIMTEWERERERAEFEQASRLYRPLSAAFSDRFVSASQTGDETNPLVPVARTVSADDNLVSAAKLKMFGHLTRRVTEWLPHSVLCKRFNIPQPRVSDSTKPKSTRPKFSVFNFLDAAEFNKPSSADVDDGCAESDDSRRTEQASVPMSEPEPGPDLAPSSKPAMDVIHQENETKISSDARIEKKTSSDAQMEELEQLANKLDLYKAIFLSSSEESDDDDKSPEAQNVSIQKQSASELNVLRNTSPPRGIFANLNFDALNSKENKLPVSAVSKDNTNDLSSSAPSQKTSEPNEDISKPNNTLESTEKAASTTQKAASSSDTKNNPPENTIESEMYGPYLPKQLTFTKVEVTINESSSGSDDEWVELKSSRKSVSSKKRSSKKQKVKSKRKSKKNKKHKHKKKEK